MDIPIRLELSNSPGNLSCQDGRDGEIPELLSRVVHSGLAKSRALKMSWPGGENYELTTR